MIDVLEFDLVLFIKLLYLFSIMVVFLDYLFDSKSVDTNVNSKKDINSLLM